jgi:hypothetical protein
VSCFRIITWWRNTNDLKPFGNFPQSMVSHQHPKSMSPNLYNNETPRYRCGNTHKQLNPQTLVEIRFSRIPHANKRTQHSYMTKTPHKSPKSTHQLWHSCQNVFIRRSCYGVTDLLLPVYHFKYKYVITRFVSYTKLTSQSTTKLSNVPR